LGKRSYAVEAQKNYELMKTFLKDSDSYEIIVTFMNAEGMLAYSRAWKFCISSRADNACVHPQQFAKFMASCGALGDPNISWVTFHGAHGIARMIRSFLSPQDLPSQWCSYIGHRRAFFPAIYDVALLVRRSSDIVTIPWIECKGGLFDVAQALNLKEIEADMEAARVLLTLRCYMRLAERPDFPGTKMAVQGLLKELLLEMPSKLLMDGGCMITRCGNRILVVVINAILSLVRVVLYLLCSYRIFPFKTHTTEFLML
jgi:hypothetical protein